MSAGPPQAAVEAAIARIPYAGFLGVRARLDDGRFTLVLPFQEHLIGNPLLPALHGGVIGAFMEMTALIELSLTSPKLPKTINVQTDYLRSGRPEDSFARAEVIKIGRRIANVQVEAWQSDPDKPIAALRGHFLVAEDGPPAP